ncbi:hypothetical protein Trydic_g5649 [Trypoxylus dichotomus]
MITGDLWEDTTTTTACFLNRQPLFVVVVELEIRKIYKGWERMGASRKGGKRTIQRPGNSEFVGRNSSWIRERVLGKSRNCMGEGKKIVGWEKFGERSSESRSFSRSVTGTVYRRCEPKELEINFWIE